jgi:hypothetical protein
MAIINQANTYSLLEKKLADTTNPRHRLLLSRVLQHAKGEVTGDLDAVMGTLAQNAVYRAWRQGPEMNPEGFDNIRQYYITEIFGRGRHCLEHDMDRVIVGDDAVVTDGVLRSVMWGRDMQEMGMPVDDPDACYLVQYRNLISWPFNEEGYIVGEESYACPVKDYITKIEDADLPESFKTYLASRKQSEAAA